MKITKISMKTVLALAVLAFTSVLAQAFTLSSNAVTGPSETGFYSGICSQGRLDTMYGAKEKITNRTSFPIAWTDLPAGTKALALVLDDPDAKPVMGIMGVPGDSFIHWLAADIDPELTGGLKTNASQTEMGFVQGVNSAGTIGYTAPQPPANIPAGAKKPIIHIYRLKMYALSAPTGLTAGFTLPQLEAAIKDKTISKAELDISYSNE